MKIDIDLSKVPDQYCSRCHKKKEKYIGKLLGLPAVMFRPQCSCSDEYRGFRKTDKQKFEELQTPFWKLMGQKPKPKDIALENYLHRRNMGYGDWRREREAGLAKNPGALNDFERHYKKYGGNNEPGTPFNKAS